MKQYTECEMTVWELQALWELFARTPEFVASIPRESFNPMLKKGLIQLWAEPDALTPVAAVITELQKTDAGMLANVLSYAGKAPEDDVRLLGAIQLWARKNGCSSLRATCKDAQTRLFAKYGFVKVANVIELELKDE